MRQMCSWFETSDALANQLPGKVHRVPKVHLVTNNRFSDFSRPYSSHDQQLDCCLCHIVEWGHAFTAHGGANSRAVNGPEFQAQDSERVKQLDNQLLWLK